MPVTALSMELPLHRILTIRRSRCWRCVIERRNPIVQGSVDYLERVAATLTAPWSLAWAILALAAHRRPITSLSSSLVALPDLSSIEDTSTLAVVCLALDQPRALQAFGVTL